MTDRLWMLRHGATEWSQRELHTGRADPPLSAEGREQAAAAGHRLEGRRFARVFVSPQLRARETCDLAGFGEPAEVWDELVEWDYGRYEGLTDHDTDERRPGWSLFRDGAPEGESPAQVAARVQRILGRLAPEPGPCLLVGHGKLLRALAALWLAEGIELGASLPLDPAAVSVLERQDNVALLRLWNFRGALPG
jgi:broad specificity phosphatase PhoE